MFLQAEEGLSLIPARGSRCTGDWFRCSSRQGNRPRQDPGGRANSEDNRKDKARACDKGREGRA